MLSNMIVMNAHWISISFCLFVICFFADWNVKIVVDWDVVSSVDCCIVLNCVDASYAADTDCDDVDDVVDAVDEVDIFWMKKLKVIADACNLKFEVVDWSFESFWFCFHSLYWICALKKSFKIFKSTRLRFSLHIRLIVIRVFHVRNVDSSSSIYLIK